jgi:hypothetical protein
MWFSLLFFIPLIGDFDFIYNTTVNKFLLIRGISLMGFLFKYIYFYFYYFIF